MKKRTATAKRATKDLEPRKDRGVKGGATASTSYADAIRNKLTESLRDDQANAKF